METFLSVEFLNRSVRTWLTAAVILATGIAIAIIVRVIARAMVRRKEKRGAPASGPLAFGLKAMESFVSPAVVLGAAYGAVAALELEGTVHAVMSGILIVLLSLLATRFTVAAVNALFKRAGDREGSLDIKQLKPLRSLSVLVIWSVGLLFLLDNLGFDITAVVAGLGIGGIAVALAAQAVLGDLFSYFVILFDKPFVLGDFLKFGSTMGSIERIGIKSTRLRAISGEQISVSNSDLTDSRIQNYGRMDNRLVIFSVRVKYGTSITDLKRIPDLIKESVESQDQTAFGRAHFKTYEEWSLVFEVVYTVLTSDYTRFMDIQEGINFAVYERFESEGIDFAVPSQTITVESDQ